MATTVKPEVNWKMVGLIIFNTSRIMKRFISCFMLIASIAVTFSSCNKVEIVSTPSDHHVILRAGNPETQPDTRTVMNGTTVYWNVGDRIGVTNGSENSNVEFTSTLNAAASVSEFESSNTVSGDLYAYYPYTINGLNKESAVKIDIPSIQNPTVSSFDGNADILVSKKFTVDETTSVAELQFTRATAVVKVVLKDTDKLLSGEKIKSLSLTTQEVDITGRANLSLTGQALTSIYYNASKTVSAEFSSEDSFVINSSNPVLFSIYPVTLAKDSKLTVNAITDNKTIVKEIALPSDIILSAGKVTTLSVSISEMNIIDTPSGHTLPIADYFGWNDAISDGSTDLSNTITDIHDDNEVPYIAAASKYYAGANNTIKFGTGSYNGYFKTIPLDLSSAFDIYVSTKQYNEKDGGVLEVFVDDALVQSITLTSEMTETKIERSAATATSTIKVGTSEKRAYIGEFVVVKHGNSKPVPKPAKPIIIVTNPVAVAATATSIDIPYEIKNPVQGQTLTAEIAADATWIANASISTDKVVLTISANEDASRSGVITLKYPGASDKTVTVSQNEPIAPSQEGVFTLTSQAIADAHTAAWTYTSGLKTIVAVDGSEWIANNTYASKNQPTIQMNTGKGSYVLTPKVASGKTIKKIKIGLKQKADGTGNDGTRACNLLTADGKTIATVAASDLIAGYSIADSYDQLRIEPADGATYITGITIEFE